jgi:hypothetical protein
MNYSVFPYSYFEELRYILDIIIAEYLLFLPSPLKRRPKFWLRFSISTPLLIGCCFFYFPIFKIICENTTELGNFRFVFIAWYSFLILLSCLNLLFLFDTNFGIILSRSLIAWCFQHIKYAIVNEAMGLGFWKECRTDYLWAYILISFASSALVFLIMYLIFHRFMKIKDIDISNNSLFSFFYVCFFFILLFTTFVNQKAFNYWIDEIPYNAYLMVAVDCLVCTIVLLTQFMIYQLKFINIQKNEAQLLLAEREKQFEQNKEAISIINKKSHDLKHQILALKGMESEEQDEALKEVYESVNVYDSSFNTGNEVLDTILTQKKLLADKERISITSIIDGKALDCLDKLDLYVLFGNALDNAIEASEKLKNKEERLISINIKEVKGFLSIQIENTFNGELHMQGEGLTTSKKNSAYHGYGFQSIKDIATKYHGVAEYHVDKNVFILQILIPEKH